MAKAGRKGKDIEYLEKNGSELDMIKPLWEKLLEYHRDRSQYFSEYYASINFELRKQTLLEKSRDGAIRVDLAIDKERNQLIGYCVSTLSGEKQGEIESIYVEPEYRGSGVGDNLMRKALAWMDINQARKKILSVAQGNESVMGFYRRYKFYPRITILEQVGW